MHAVLPFKRPSLLGLSNEIKSDFAEYHAAGQAPNERTHAWLARIPGHLEVSLRTLELVVIKGGDLVSRKGAKEVTRVTTLEGDIVYTDFDDLYPSDFEIKFSAAQQQEAVQNVLDTLALIILAQKQPAEPEQQEQREKEYIRFGPRQGH
jgi:hypothetical protein